MPTVQTSPLVLPPPFTQVAADGNALQEALRLAPVEGAGSFVYRCAGGVWSVAVVLEPEVPLATARLAVFAGMGALGDALAAHCAPERSVRFDYPDGIRYDKARLGGGRLSVPQGCAEDQVPDWLVFSAELIADRDHLADPGVFPDSTSLKEEEFDGPEAIMETFASYLMLYFDRWKHQGFAAVAERYLARIDPPMLSGTRVLEDGDLVERTPGGAERRIRLAEGLAACRWRDAERDGPRL
ncbi:biotin/lipoate--protein ligase family protein [Halodurantibacterium flavum]|uniref:Biotin/lipoate--protein ligase family protein n=2 Tax=Halodurantibacterium flavum TaxID=1382802 RepID=A0ABW4SB00_9RHOB